MKPLCKKVYIDKIMEIVALILGAVFDTVFIIHKEDDWFWSTFILLFTALLVYFLLDIIHWIFQPNILIYQYETGIVIHRTQKLEYTSIERVYFKKYIDKKGRDTYSGIIYIQLKCGKVYKIRNAFNPLEVVGVISRMKQQKKFR